MKHPCEHFRHGTEINADVEWNDRLATYEAVNVRCEACMHSGRHDHHVIVVGSGDRDRPTDEGAKAAFCATLIACLLAYALIKF